MSVPTRPGDPLFVVQHHLATADHYDLRLEIAGVLVSWAVPKGPSADPTVRRLARRVGDHELAHADVEGVGGRVGDRITVVQVWDRGTWAYDAGPGRPDTAAAALDAGRLSFVLDGRKLQGPFTLVRTARSGEDMWLLLARRGAVLLPDPAADASVLTGRTLAQIAADGGAA